MRLLLARLLAGVIAYTVLFGLYVFGIAWGILPVMSVEVAVALVALPAIIFPLALGVPMIVLVVRGRRKKKTDAEK